MPGRFGRLRLAEIKEQTYAASVEARQTLDKAKATLSLADRTMLEMKEMGCKAIAAWTEVALEILDGGTIRLGAEENALPRMRDMLLAGKGGDFPFYIGVQIREDEDKQEQPKQPKKPTA